ncbi:MAG: anti-sigma F factor [Clostridiales bacterium]|nr:anti-sigma F factor [Clostridiales bacterium]
MSVEQELKLENEGKQRRKLVNEMQIVFEAKPENEGFARTAVAAFVAPLNPTMDELADVKTAVSEAVTNCVIHGYEMQGGKIFLDAAIWDRILVVSVTDEGCGIADIEKAREPMFTTRPEWERSGMGFSFMEAFMDAVEVESSPGRGTRVLMQKEIR